MTYYEGEYGLRGSLSEQVLTLTGQQVMAACRSGYDI